MVGKFFIIGFIWSYLFQILSEIRHWFWDMGNASSYKKMVIPKNQFSNNGSFYDLVFNEYCYNI